MTGSTLLFAKQEWARYAIQMDAGYDPGKLCFVPFTPEESADMQVKDPFWDDAYRIRVCHGQGVISYSNERSALLAVYRLLQEAGCAFLRPGPQGEIVPKTALNALCAEISMQAAYRHRCICIEGSNTLDNVLDMIDFAPKAGYNAYFTQFMEAYTFFERWYTHMDNPLRAPGPFSEALAREMQNAAIQEIKKRGLIYHAVGHGWTCEPFGIPGKHWADDGVEATPEQARHLAMLNGKRAIRGGIGLNTNLCYSNPETRNIMTDAVANYAVAHPEIDILHVWLADENNNFCECEACANLMPADAYVMLLNEIDGKLTRLGSPVRIVFLLYYELLFPPEKEKLINQDRFLLMYAPITRSFSSSYKGVVPRRSSMPYVRNKLYFSRDIAENLGYLDAWHEHFSGDGFDFDYHLCGACNFDPGHMTIARVLYDDINTLHDLHLDGMINCQLQRIAMPNAFALYLGGQTLCDPVLDYNAAMDKYFRQAYGDDHRAAKEFLSTLSALFPMEAMMSGNRLPEDAAKLRQLKDYLETVKLPHHDYPYTAQRRSWELLRFWHQFMIHVCSFAIQLTLGSQEELHSAWKALELYAWEHEPEVQSEFDTFCFLHQYRPR